VLARGRVRAVGVSRLGRGRLASRTAPAARLNSCTIASSSTQFFAQFGQELGGILSRHIRQTRRKCTRWTVGVSQQFVHREKERVSTYLSEQGRAGMPIKATVPRDFGSRREEQQELQPGVIVALRRATPRQRALYERTVHDLARLEPSGLDDRGSHLDARLTAFAASLRNTARILESCLRAEERLFHSRHPKGICNSAAARSMRRRLRVLRTTIARLESARSRRE
jgi:hypothetical protein